MRSTEARVCFELGNYFLGEGPREVVVGAEPELVWVNIQTAADSTYGTVQRHRFSGGQTRSWPAPERVGFVLPVAGGNRILAGVEKGLRVCDLATGTWSEPLATIPDDNPRTVINDAEIVPGGKAVVFGTKDTKFDEKAKLAQLYMYTVDDNRISVLADKQICSNGKVFVSDDRGLLLFDIDTQTRKVARYRFDAAARTATPDGVAIDLKNQVGFPDGMRGCGDGTAIIAFYNPEFAEAGRAVRFDLTTGEAVEEWTTPGSPRVTCPLLLKRPDGVKLILTTATEGMPADMHTKCPNAGCLFIAETQFADCPAPQVVRLP
jgi:sugar lactone lactonase YvrE